LLFAFCDVSNQSPGLYFFLLFMISCKLVIPYIDSLCNKYPWSRWIRFIGALVLFYKDEIGDVFISFLFPLFSFPTPHLCSCFQWCVLISLACVCYIIVEPSHIHSLFGHGHIWGVAYCLFGLKFALESRTSESLSVSLSLCLSTTHTPTPKFVLTSITSDFFSQNCKKKRVIKLEL